MRAQDVADVQAIVESVVADDAYTRTQYRGPVERRVHANAMAGGGGPAAEPTSPRAKRAAPAPLPAADDVDLERIRAFFMNFRDTVPVVPAPRFQTRVSTRVHTGADRVFLASDARVSGRALLQERIDQGLPTIGQVTSERTQFKNLPGADGGTQLRPLVSAEWLVTVNTMIDVRTLTEDESLRRQLGGRLIHLVDSCLRSMFSHASTASGVLVLNGDPPPGVAWSEYVHSIICDGGWEIAPTSGFLHVHFQLVLLHYGTHARLDTQTATETLRRLMEAAMQGTTTPPPVDLQVVWEIELLPEYGPVLAFVPGEAAFLHTATTKLINKAHVVRETAGVAMKAATLQDWKLMARACQTLPVVLPGRVRVVSHATSDSGREIVSASILARVWQLCGQRLAGGVIRELMMDGVRYMNAHPESCGLTDPGEWLQDDKTNYEVPMYIPVHAKLSKCKLASTEAGMPTDMEILLARVGVVADCAADEFPRSADDVVSEDHIPIA